jgi:ABC-2 type transport system permease protein
VITFRLAWRQIRRSTVVVAGVMAVLMAAGGASFRSLYPTEASRQLLVRTLGSAKAIDALYGRATHIDTLGGFVAWRYGVFLGVVAGVWAALAVTRLLRGEEDAGRSDLLLVAPWPRRRLMAGQLLAALVGAAILALAVFVGALAAGLAVGGSALMAAGLGLEATVFAGVAAVASQLWGQRRQAAGWTGGLVGGAYLVRAVGDGSSAGWLVWLSPLGWAERLVPFGPTSLIGLVPLVGCSLGLAGLATVLNARRDVGVGLLTRTTLARRGGRPLASPVSLDWRLNRGRFVAWAAGVGGYGLVVGFLATSLTDYFRQDASVSDVTSKLASGASMTSAQGLLGLIYGFLALVLALFAGSQLVSGRSEEAQGRLDGLLVSPWSRTRWLAVRLGLGTAAVVGLAVVAGVSTWLGEVLTGSSSGLGPVLGGALNTVPVALLFGALAAVTFALAPRWTTAVAFGSVGLAYLLQLVGSLADAPRRLVDLSPFSHVAAVPAQPVDRPAMVAMLGLALLGAALAEVGWRRRDVLPA